MISNDLQYYSYVLNKHYIENHRILKFDGLADFIPSLRDVELSERKDLSAIICPTLLGLKDLYIKIIVTVVPKAKKNNGYISPMRMAKERRHKTKN